MKSIIMKILGISLSEFHDKAGFQLVQSVPSVTVLTKQQFNLCSDLILPRQQLCGRLLALQFKEDYYLVMRPLLSKNKNHDKTYKRQKYIYSVSILVAKRDYLDLVKQPLYKQTVLKIAQFFKTIEQTNHIIYEHHKYTPYIVSQLTQIYEQINKRRACQLTYQYNYFAFLNVNQPPTIQKKTKIMQSSVPVTLLSERQIDQIESQFGRLLMEYAYKGVYTFKKICKIHPDKKQSQISIFYSKTAEKGLVFILDIINVNNIYVLTQKIGQLVGDQAQTNQELLYIANVVNVSSQPLNTNEILCLYLQFNRVGTLSKIIDVNRRLIARIDLVKFIRMGQIHGILVRIHQKIVYSQLPAPLIVPPEALRRLLAEREKTKISVSDRLLQEQMEKMGDLVRQMLNSNVTVDEMMVNMDLDYDRLISLLNTQNRYIMNINDN